jgi:hypothetical protein
MEPKGSPLSYNNLPLGPIQNKESLTYVIDFDVHNMNFKIVQIQIYCRTATHITDITEQTVLMFPCI